MNNSIITYDDEMSQGQGDFLPYSGEEYTYIDDVDFYENMYSPLKHWLSRNKMQRVPTVNVYSGTGLMDWTNSSRWNQAFEARYYANKAQSMGVQPTLPEMGKRNYIAYTPYFTNSGSINFRPTISEIDDNAIIEKGWDGVPIELSYNTTNNELNYTNYFIYQNMMKKQLEKFRKKPMDYNKYSYLVSKLLEKEWLLNEITSLNDVGFTDDDDERIAELRKYDNELDNYVISQAKAIYRLKRDAQNEYARRLGKKRMYSIDEISRMPYEYQIEEAKNIIFSAFKTTSDGRYLEASTEQLKDVVKKLEQIRRKSNAFRREDALEKMSWFGRMFGSLSDYLERTKEDIIDKTRKPAGNLFNTYLKNSLYGLAEKTLGVINWLPEKVAFDLDHPLEEYITAFEKFVESKATLSGTTGKLRLLNPDYRGIGEKEKREVQRMKDDFIGGLVSEVVDVVADKGLSIFAIATMTKAGASIGLAGGPIAAVAGGIIGAGIGLLLTAAGVGGLQPLKRAGYGVEGYSENFSNDEVLAIGRLLYRKIDDEEYKRLIEEMPEQKDRIDVMKKLGDMYDNRIFEDYNQVGAIVGNLIGDIVGPFRSYGSILKGKAYLQTELIKMGAAPQIWRHVPLLNKLENIKVAEKVLDWAGRLPNERFVIDPGMKPVVKFFKRAAKMTEEGIKTWAIAEMVRNNPYTDFDDIVVAARTGALFNLWSLSVGMGLRRVAGDKWLNKSVEDIESRVNKLLTDVNEKKVRFDQILRDAGRHDIIDLHKRLDDAILDKYILIGDLLISNVAQTASLRLLEGGFDGLTEYFGGSDILGDLFGGVFLGAYLGYGKFKSYHDLKSKYRSVEKHLNDAIKRMKEDAKYNQLLNDIQNKVKAEEEEKKKLKEEADTKRAKEAQVTVEEESKKIARETPVEDISKYENIFVSEETHAKVEEAAKIEGEVGEIMQEEVAKIEEGKDESSIEKPVFKFQEFSPIDYETYDKPVVDDLNDYVHAESGGDISTNIYSKGLYEEGKGLNKEVLGEVKQARKLAEEYLANNKNANTDDILFYKFDVNRKRMVPVLRNNRTMEFAKKLVYNELKRSKDITPNIDDNDLVITDENGNIYILSLKHKEIIDEAQKKAKRSSITGIANILDPLDTSEAGKGETGKDEDLFRDSLDKIDEEIQEIIEKIREEDKALEEKELKEIMEEASKDPAKESVNMQMLQEFIESVISVSREAERKANERKKKSNVIDIVEIDEESLPEGTEEVKPDEVSLDYKKEEQEETLKEVDILELFDEIDRKMAEQQAKRDTVEEESIEEKEDVATEEVKRVDEDVPEFDLLDEIDRILAESLLKAGSKAGEAEGKVKADTEEAKTEEAIEEEAKEEVQQAEAAKGEVDQQVVEDVRKDLADILTDQSDGKIEGEILAQILLEESEGKKGDEDVTDVRQQEIAEQTLEQSETEQLIEQQVEKDLENVSWEFTKEDLKKDFLRRLWKEVRPYLNDEEKARIRSIVKDSISEKGNEFINDLSKQEILYIVKEAFKRHLREKYKAELEKDPIKRLEEKKKELDKAKKKKDRSKKIEHVAKRSMYKIFIDYFQMSMLTEAISQTYGIDPAFIKFINSETAIAMGGDSVMFVNAVHDNAEGYGKLMLNIVMDANAGFDDVMKKVPHEVWHIFNLNVIKKPGNEKLAEEYYRVFEKIISQYEAAENLFERSKAHYVRMVWRNMLAVAKAEGDYKTYVDLNGYDLDNKKDHTQHKEVYDLFYEYLRKNDKEAYDSIEEMAKDEVMAEIFRLSENAREALNIKGDMIRLRDKIRLYAKEALGGFIGKDQDVSKLYLDFMQFVSNYKIFSKKNLQKISKDMEDFGKMMDDTGAIRRADISIYTTLFNGIKELFNYEKDMMYSIGKKIGKLFKLQSQIESVLNLSGEMTGSYDAIGALLSTVPGLKITKKYELIDYLNKKYSNKSYSEFEKEFTKHLAGNWDEHRRIVGDLELEDFLKIVWIKYGPGTYEDNIVASILLRIDENGKTHIELRTTKADKSSSLFDIEVRKGYKKSIGTVLTKPEQRKKKAGWEIAKTIMRRLYNGINNETDLLLNALDGSQVVELASITLVESIRGKFGKSSAYKADVLKDLPLEFEDANIDSGLQSVIRTVFKLDESIIAEYGDSLFKTLASRGLFTTLASDKAYYFINASMFVNSMLERFGLKFVDNKLRGAEKLSSIVDAAEAIMGKYDKENGNLIDFIGNLEAAIAMRVMQGDGMLDRWRLKRGWDDIGKDGYLSIFDIYEFRSVNGKFVMLPKKGLAKAQVDKIDKAKFEQVTDIIQKHMKEYKNISTPLGEYVVKDYGKTFYELFNEMKSKKYTDEIRKNIVDEFSDLLLAKLMGISDSILMSSIDPSMSFMWHSYKVGDNVESKKYIYKYSTYTHYEHSVLSLEKLEKILEDVGVIKNGEVVGKGVHITKDIDGNEELHAQVYVFDPESWTMYAKELREVGMVEAAEAVEQLVKMLGDNSLDGGTISINKEFSDGKEIHNILGLLGGTLDRGSYKTRAMIMDGNNASPWKHAIHPEYIGESSQSLTPGELLYRMLIKTLYNNNICIMTVPSTIKTNGVSKPRVFEASNGKRYLIDHTGRKLGILEPDGRVKDLDPEDKPYEVISGLAELFGTAVRNGKLGDLSKSISMRDDQITKNPKFMEGKDRELLGFSMVLTGKYGMSWDSQKGDPHDKASSIPFRYYDFSVDSPLSNSIDSIKDVFTEGELDWLRKLGIKTISDIINHLAMKNGDKINIAVDGFNGIVQVVKSIMANKASDLDLAEETIKGMHMIITKLYDRLTKRSDPDSLTDDDLFNEDDDDVMISKLLDTRLFEYDWKREYKILDKILKNDDGILLDMENKDDRIEFLKRLPILFTLSDSIVMNERNVQSILQKTSLLWNIVQKEIYDNIMFRQKGCIAVLDSDRHAREDMYRLLNYEKSRNPNFQLPILEESYKDIVDGKNGQYKDYSIGISVSMDILQKFGLRMGSRVFVILTPSDSGQSLVPLRVTGLLSPEKRNTLTFNSAMQINILGRDHDIDVMGLLVPSKDWKIEHFNESTKRKEEIDLFTLLHKSLMANGIHKGELKQDVSKIRKQQKKKFRSISVKKTGMQEPIEAYINEYDSVENPKFKNTYRYNDDVIINPLNFDTPLESRKVFSKKKVGTYAYYYNIYSQLANTIDSIVPIKVSHGNNYKKAIKKVLKYVEKEYGENIARHLVEKYGVGTENDKLLGSKFKFDVDYDKHSLLVSFMKEGSVDVYNKHPYKLEIGETLAEFTFADINIFGKNYSRLSDILSDNTLTELDRLAIKGILSGLMKHMLDAYAKTYNPIKFAKKSIIDNLTKEGLSEKVDAETYKMSDILDVPIRNKDIYGNSIDGILASRIIEGGKGLSDGLMQIVRSYSEEMYKLADYYTRRRLTDRKAVDTGLKKVFEEKLGISYEEFEKDLDFAIEHGIMILNAITSRALPGRYIHSFMPFWLTNIVPLHDIMLGKRYRLTEAINISIASESVLDGLMNYILNSREALVGELSVQQKTYNQLTGEYEYVFNGEGLDRCYPVSFRKMTGGQQEANRYSTFGKMYDLEMWLYMSGSDDIMVRYKYGDTTRDMKLTEFIENFNSIDIISGSDTVIGIIDKMAGEYAGLDRIKAIIESFVNMHKWSREDYRNMDLQGNVDRIRKIGKKYIIEGDTVTLTGEALDAIVGPLKREKVKSYTDDGVAYNSSSFLNYFGYTVEAKIDKDGRVTEIKLVKDKNPVKEIARGELEEALKRKAKSMIYDGLINNSVELVYKSEHIYKGVQLVPNIPDGLTRDQVYPGLGGLMPYISSYEARVKFAVNILENYILSIAKRYAGDDRFSSDTKRKLIGLIVGKALDYTPDYSLVASSLPRNPSSMKYGGLKLGDKGESNVLRHLKEYVYKHNKIGALGAENQVAIKGMEKVDPNVAFEQLSKTVNEFIKFCRENNYNEIADDLDAYLSSLQKDRDILNSFSLDKIIHETKLLYNNLYEVIGNMDLSPKAEDELFDRLMDYAKSGDNLIKSMFVALNLPKGIHVSNASLFGVAHNIGGVGKQNLAATGLLDRPSEMLLDTSRPLGMSWLGRALNESLRSKGITPLVNNKDMAYKDYDVNMADIFIDYYRDKKVSFKSIGFVSGDSILSEVSSKSKKRVSTLLGKVSNILTGGIGNIVGKLGSYNTFEESFNKYTKGMKWSDGTDIDFNSFFGGANRLMNKDDREIAKKVIHEFAYQEMTNVLGIEGLEKSELKDEFYILTEKYEPEDYINLITQLKIKQLSQYYGKIIDELNDVSPGVLKHYMNEAAITVFNIHREVTDAVKKRKRFAKNVMLDRTQNIEKLMKELSIDEMNTPIALAEKLSSQKILVKPSTKLIEIPMYTVDKKGNLVEAKDKSIVITASMVKEGSIFPEYSAKAVLENKDAVDIMPYVEVSPSEIALAINSMVKQEMTNNSVNDDLYIDHIRVKDERIKGMGVMDIAVKYERIMDKLLNNKKIKLLFRFEEAGDKIVPYVHLFSTQLREYTDKDKERELGKDGKKRKIRKVKIDGKEYVSEFKSENLKASMLGINEISNFANVIVERLKNYKVKMSGLQIDKMSKKDEEVLKLSIEKFIVMKLYNMNKSYQMKRWQSFTKGLIDKINYDSITGTRVDAILAKGRNISTLLDELVQKMSKKSSENFYFYNANNASTLLTLLHDIFLEVDKSLKAGKLTDKASKFFDLYANRFLTKKEFDTAKGIRRRAINSYKGIRHKLQIKSIMEKDYNISNVISKVSTLFGDGAEYIKWNLFLNDLISNGLIKKVQVTSDVFSQYNEAINKLINTNIIDILESKYINDVKDVSVRTGFDENSLVMDEVLYSIAANKSSEIIYNRDITNEITIDNAMNLVPVSIYTYDNNVINGIYLGKSSGFIAYKGEIYGKGSDNVLIMNSTGRISVIPVTNIVKAYAGDTYKQNIKMMIDEISKVLKTNLSSTLLDEYSRASALKTKDAYVKMGQISNEIMRMLAKGNYTMSDIVKHAPNVTVALQYLNYGKLLRSALGVGGAIVSAFYNPALSMTMLGYGVKGLIGFGTGIMRKVMQNVFSNYRGLYELEGFRNTIASIASTLKYSESDAVLESQDAVQTFYKQEVGYGSYRLGLSNKKIDDLIKVMEEGNELMQNELQKQLIDDAYQSIIEGKFTRADLAKMISRVRNEIKRRHKGDDIDDDIMNYVNTMKYNTYTGEFFTEYGDNIASLMQLRRNFYEQILESAEKLTKVIPLSEELTRQMSQQSIAHHVVNKDIGSNYTKEEKRKIISEWINMSGGQYGASTRTSFGNSEIGKFMTLYGRFNKNNSVFYLDGIWRKIEEQKLLDKLGEIQPELYGMIDEKFARITSMAKTGKTNKAKLAYETDFRRAVNRKLAFGSAVGLTSMIGKVGIMYLIYLLFGKYFTNLISGSDEQIEYIDSMTGIGQIYGSGLELLIAGGTLGMLVADSGIDNSGMSDRQIVNMYKRALEAPSEFLFATGLGSGFSNLGGLLSGTAVNLGLYVLRSKSQQVNEVLDNEMKGAFYDLIKRTSGSLPFVAPLGVGYKEVSKFTSQVQQ